MQGGSFASMEDRTRKSQLAKVRMLLLVGTNMGVSWRMSFSQGNTREKKFNCGIEVFQGSKNLGQLSYRMTETYQERRIQRIQYTN